MMNYLRGPFKLRRYRWKYTVQCGASLQPGGGLCASSELTTHYSSCKVTISFYDCLVVVAVALVTFAFQFALR